MAELTLIEELSLLPGIDSIPNFVVLDTIKSLIFRSKQTSRLSEWKGIMEDAYLIADNAEVSYTRDIFIRHLGVLTRNSSDFCSRLMEDYVAVFTKNKYVAVNQLTQISFLKIAADMITPGEVIDAHPVIPLNNINPRFPYQLGTEMTLILPKKSEFAVVTNLLGLDYKMFSEKYELVKLDWNFRLNSIHPIRMMNNYTEPNPSHKWNITVQDYEDDISYLRKVYNEQNPIVLRIRWEWGRKFWTLHAKHLIGHNASASSIIARGRTLELEARQIIENNLL